jgi:dipeptidase D
MYFSDIVSIIARPLELRDQTVGGLSMATPEAVLRPYKIELLKQLPAAQETFFKWFLAITEVHRPSGDLAKATATVIGWAKALGADAKTDDAGNIVISIPASPGKESVPSLLLQGHLDIVSAGTYEEGGQVPVKLVNGYLTSGVSTLGADDGVAIAAIFAILETAGTFPHGPLEFLITSDEEIGMIGAGKLAPPPFLQSRSMINLDSDEWGEFCTSCAGSVTITYSVPIAREPFAGTALKLGISNLISGHTGVTIHQGRANAIKWIVRLLLAAKAAGLDFRLSEIAGGTRVNAIPNSTTAVVVVADAPAFTELLNKINGQIVAEFRAVEKKGPIFAIDSVAAEGNPLTAAVGYKVLNLLSAIPHGVLQNHFEIEGLVNTSQSLSIVKTDGAAVTAQVFARSNETTQIPLLIQSARAIAELGGVDVSIPEDEISLPWPSALKSKILDVSTSEYTKLVGKPPTVVGIHAGLECGTIQARGYDYLEALSIGPTINGAHTIEEKTNVDSCVKFYQLVQGIVVAWAE